MELYWVSLMVRNKNGGDPWLLAMSSPVDTLEEAHKIIDNSLYRDVDRLSAWIDIYTNGCKTTVFHECYL